ncbi:MAG: serine/threonine-protein kinase [Myxococcota bacterium]
MSALPVPDDALIRAFVRGELTGSTLERFEKALDADPALQRQVADLARDVTLVGTSIAGPQSTGRALSGDPADRHLRLGPLLGSGGMARVYSATQTHLGREVAVKTVPPGADAWAKAKLVEEARITGFLEHPGIVPVHDLIEDQQGELQVVLKRIEGQSWLRFISRPDEVRERFQLDPLDWHVSVAIAVCNAMQFAHERGVVHRDIKPANVMIGRFGEVYLLDWGVAGTLTPDPNGLLPSVLEAPFAGTLSCMAPEQVVADVERIGPSTDTYLLGSSLYHAMYGAPPFAMLTLSERRANPDAPARFPEGADVPAELASIVKRALDPRPHARFRRADELQRALELYRKHGDARRLAHRAAERAAEARRAWAGGDRLAGEQAASDADFGFRAALELRPDDAQVQQLRADLATDRVRFAVERGEPEAASWLLAGHSAPPPTLVREVTHAVEFERSERERLERIARDGDRRTGLTTKRVMLAVFGLAWLAFWSWTAASPPPVAWPMSLFLLAYLGVGVAGTLAMRRELLEHRLNREMMLVQLAMQSVAAVVGLLATPLGLAVPAVLVLMMLTWALGMGAIAAIVEPLSLVPSLTWLVAAVVSALWPAALHTCLVVGSVTHVVVPLWVSLRVRGEDGREHTQQAPRRGEAERRGGDNGQRSRTSSSSGPSCAP